MNSIPPFSQNRGDFKYIKFEILQIVSPSEDVKFSNVRGLYLRKYGTYLPNLHASKTIWLNVPENRFALKSEALKKRYTLMDRYLVDLAVKSFWMNKLMVAQYLPIWKKFRHFEY